MPKGHMNIFRNLEAMLVHSHASMRKWYMAPYRSEKNHIVIFGCGRSGTSLVRAMLDSHPSICCGPETEMLLPKQNVDEILYRLTWRYEMPRSEVLSLVQDCSLSQGQFIDALARYWCTLQEKPIWAEKTPRNIVALSWIRKRWPRARFIHVIRDGRDVVCSLMEHPKWRINALGEIERTESWQEPKVCIDRWVTEVPMGLKFRGDPLYTEVRYEDLIGDPGHATAELFEFLGLPWDPAVLRFHEISRNPLLDPQSSDGITRPLYDSAVGRWKRDLPKEVLAMLMSRGGSLLSQLGYIDLSHVGN